MSRGLWCEWKCAQYLNHKGYILKEHRLKTPYGELDLLFYHPKGFWRAVEVKTPGGLSIEDRVSFSQKGRLEKILEYLMEQLTEPVSMDLAIVSRFGRLDYIPDFLC